MFAINFKMKLKLFLSSLVNPNSKFKNTSYSQEGEDLIIKRFFEGKKSQLFYIDIGAHHPFRFSNTAIFYENGSNGVNIEANKNLFEALKNYRLRDENINVGVGLRSKSLKFYEFYESALSTFDEKIYESRIGDGWKLRQISEIQVLTLAEILKSLNINKQIDFLNVDVEGLDLEVLESNDWKLFRPTIVAVEIYNFSINYSCPIREFMKNVDYQFFAKTVNTVFFIEDLA